MNKDEKKLKQIIKCLYDGFDSAALISPNKDGSINVVREEQSEYSFNVFDESCEFIGLLDKFKSLGYLINLDAYRGLIPGKDLIRVDVANKVVSRVLIVSVNHYLYLQRKESILLVDVLNNFDEIVINKNKELMKSLYQYQKKKNR